MAKLCLPKQVADSFVAKLKDGTLDPNTMASMSSEERNKLLAGIVGEENAKNANALFESKLLLKNQQQGMITWVNKVAGLKPEVRRDIISRIQRMEKYLDSSSEKAFLKDIAEQKLGIGVSQEEAKSIVEMSQKISETKSKITEEMPDGSPERLEHGAAKVKMLSYIGSLKEKSEKMGLREYFSAKGFVKGISDLAGLAKSAKASLDNSALLRQGWRTAFTNPGIWLKNAAKSFVDIAKTLKGEDALGAVKADVYSRKNSMNGMYDKMKLAIGTGEEAYPTSLPEKVPFFGRLFKASESAYEGFLVRQRADIADKMIEIAEKSKVNLKDEAELKGIGNLVNSLTGRGNLGALEKGADVVNNVFFSPRFVKSNIDTLLLHPLGIGTSKFGRKQAALNLVKVVMGTAALLGIAKAIRPDSVEIDPRSSDFGKIKVGNTRFDVTGGASSLITLAAREFTQSSKSSTTGKVSKLGAGTPGSMTGLDVMFNFLTNKTSPMASVVVDLIRGADFQGNKPTITGEIANLLMPLPITTVQDSLTDPNSANVIVTLMADALGISANTYGSQRARLERTVGPDINPKVLNEIDRLNSAGYMPSIAELGNTGKTAELKKQIPKEKYDQFLKDFGTTFQKKVSNTIQSPYYLNMPIDKKQNKINDIRQQTIDSLLFKYGYKKPKKQRIIEK